MKSIKIVAVIAILCSFANTYAQSNQDHYERPIIGDTVMDLSMINLVNYPTSTAKISDFRGKLLILDYWFTGCGPCIATWPKLLKLQEQFKDKIEIILVNHLQGKEVVQNFIKSWNKKSGRDFILPSVTGDTVLHKALPPSGYPTIIWIDQNGIFKGKSKSTQLNDKTIRALLDNKEINLSEITKGKPFLAPRQPLFINKNGGAGKNILWYSTVSGYTKGLDRGFEVFHADSSGYLITLTSRSIEGLIRVAFSKGPYNERALNRNPRFPTSRLVYRVKDPSRFLHTINGVRQLQNLYTYQLISYEPRTADQLRRIMQNDIRNYFNVDIKWQAMKKKCLVMTAEDTTLLNDPAYIGRPFYGRNKEGKNVLKNVTVDNFLTYLEEYKAEYATGYPLVDETGFHGGLDLVFDDSNIGNYKELDKVLYKKYKIHLKLEEREVDLLVIRNSKEYRPGKSELAEEEEKMQIKENAKSLAMKAARERNWEAYQKYTIDYVNTYLMDDFLELQKYAWRFYENEAITNEKSLKEALKWAERSIELNSNHSPYNHGVYAALLFKIGRKEEAFVLAEKALRLFDMMGESYNVTSALREEVNAFKSN